MPLTAARVPFARAFARGRSPRHRNPGATPQKPTSTRQLPGDSVTSRESFRVWVSARVFFFSVSFVLFSVKRSQKNSPLFRLSSFEPQPNKITVAKGETIEFVNNKASPHNVVFDEDNVPSGVNADSISHEDYLNGPGEKVTNKFDTPGTYGYYCEPHQGAGMQGTIIVQ